MFFNFITINLWAFLSVITAVGIIVGSFLNVVIHRLPIMMHSEWRKQCLLLLEQSPITTERQGVVYNLCRPASHCSHCKHKLRFWENIPLLSFILLAGKCSHCKNAIAWTYPIVELIAGISSLIIAWYFSWTEYLLPALLFSWILIILVTVDIQQQLLPDILTLGLLWLGLFVNIFGLFAEPRVAIIGAIAGYLSLWLVATIFKWCTGKEGMGHGDFKLLGALGAWLGWKALFFVVLFSSLLGATIGILLITCRKYSRHTLIPFGPYLALAGWIALLYGNKINLLLF